MDNNKINSAYIWMISLTAACGGLLFGYDWVVIGGAKPFYEVYFAITNPSVSGFVMGSALIGCILGAVAAGVLSDKYGRKNPLIVAALLFIISAIGSAIAGSLTTFVIYRILVRFWMIGKTAAPIHRGAAVFVYPCGTKATGAVRICCPIR